MATVAQMRTLALGLPETEERTHFGDVAFAVKKKLFASLDEEARTAIVDVGHEAREQLIAASPEIFSRYGRTSQGAPLVIQLPKIELKELKRLVEISWKLRAPAKLVEQHEAGGAAAAQAPAKKTALKKTALKKTAVKSRRST